LRSLAGRFRWCAAPARPPGPFVPAAARSAYNVGTCGHSEFLTRPYFPGPADRMVIVVPVGQQRIRPPGLRKRGQPVTSSLSGCPRIQTIPATWS